MPILSVLPKKAKYKALITITNGGLLGANKMEKKLWKEAHDKLWRMFGTNGKYKRVPMLLMNNLTVKAGEFVNGQDVMIHFPDKDSFYIVHLCYIKNANKKLKKVKKNK